MTDKTEPEDTETNEATGLSEGLCWLHTEHRQCCCICRWHLRDYHHCTTNKKLRDETNGCVCSKQKGWVCVAPEMDRVYSGWPNHSIGCEMFTKKKKPA